LFLQNQNGQLEQKIAQEAELNRLGIQEQKSKNSGTDKSNSRPKLATVLIRSALVGDIARYSRSHFKNGKTLSKPQQLPPQGQPAPNCSPAKSANPNPVSGIDSGARSFNDVNDFLLTSNSLLSSSPKRPKSLQQS